MKTGIALGLPLATLLFAAAAAVALRARGQRAEATRGARHRIAPGTSTAGESRPRPAATAGMHGGAAEQVQLAFHELHADGRNALCAVCDSQYRTA
jgi:hypothetical protein